MGRGSDRQEQAAELSKLSKLPKLWKLCGVCHSEPCRARQAGPQQQLREIGSQQKGKHTLTSRMRPLSRIAPASFRAGATARRGRAAANQKPGGEARSSTRRATRRRGCTTDSRRSCQTPVFARSGARWRGSCGRRWEPPHLNIVLWGPGLCERPVGIPVASAGQLRVNQRNWDDAGPERTLNK